MPYLSNIADPCICLGHPLLQFMPPPLAPTPIRPMPLVSIAEVHGHEIVTLSLPGGRVMQFESLPRMLVASLGSPTFDLPLPVLPSLHDAF